jgi:hypothetical protein
MRRSDKEKQVPDTSKWFRGAMPRRALAVGVATCAIAAPALAVTQPWQPEVGRPGIDPPARLSAAGPSKVAQEALAILRRPQTAADRSATAPLLRGVVGGQVDGVQTDGIRSLASGWALVPAETVETGPGRVSRDQVCFTDGDTLTCGPAARLRAAGVMGSEATQTATTFTGVVPDGVAAVRFDPQVGAARQAPVQGNFFVLEVDEVAPPRMIKAPEGHNGPAEIPAPPLPPAGELQWLPGNGEVVGPTVG